MQLDAQLPMAIGCGIVWLKKYWDEDPDKK